MNEAKELNQLVEQISEKVVEKTIKEKYLMSRMAVIVNEFDPETNTASVIFPTDLNKPTSYKYPNRTGKNTLAMTVWENGKIKIFGDKVYLIYQTNNISQGWLESNTPLKLPEEGGGGGGTGGAYVSVNNTTLVITNSIDNGDEVNY